ncbi:uncharacterized protein LOC128992820 [Macrosteles quadrilineatus]|uniref:uncharacterized protein LOC128992820 n=1 Tax=Macrosteles quadrilineatus TaxID=74068 RepID=UPI0023E2C05B|nr:uncharacterized protein LOC128992820 [Macrosteles quadrilineatus]
MEVITTIFFIVLLDINTIQANEFDVKPHELAEDHKDEFLMTLIFMDKDGSGQITVDELKHCLDRFKIEVTNDEVKEMIRVADTDGNGELSVSELMKQFYGPTWEQVKENVDEAFPLADKNGDEMIDHGELKQFVHRINKNLTDDEIQRMLEDADKDGDGKISRREFFLILLHNHRRNPEPEPYRRHTFTRIGKWVRGIFRFKA